eukprot:6950529-Prymnesium_polylepis.5
MRNGTEASECLPTKVQKPRRKPSEKPRLPLPRRWACVRMGASAGSRDSWSRASSKTCVSASWCS